MALNKQKKDFCKYKAQGFSNEESAKAAGYSASYAKTHAHKLLDNYEIKEEVERLTKKVEQIAEEKFNITVESILKDIVEIKDRCMQKVPVMKYDKEEKEYKQLQDELGNNVWTFDSQAALKACDMLGKCKGIYEADNKQQQLNAKALEIKIVK